MEGQIEDLARLRAMVRAHHRSRTTHLSRTTRPSNTISTHRRGTGMTLATIMDTAKIMMLDIRIWMGVVEGTDTHRKMEAIRLRDKNTMVTIEEEETAWAPLEAVVEGVPCNVHPLLMACEEDTIPEGVAKAEDIQMGVQ